MLTILIPSYNHEKHVIECLDAALSVDVPGKKIIVIDDGSTDSTPSLIKNYVKKNKNHDISFIEKSNSGLVSSLNLGLSMIDTEFMYLVASDDIAFPSGLLACLDELKSRPGLKFVIGGAVNLYSDGSTDNVYRDRHSNFFAQSYESRSKKIFLDYPKPLLLQSTVFRTEAIRSVGGWDKDIILDDYSLFVKLFLKYKKDGSDYLFDPGLLVVKYRQHESNASKNYPRQYLMVRQVINKYAASDVKNKAIGYRLGFYMMLSLKEGRFGDFIKILFDSNISQILWGFAIMPVYLYRYIARSL